MSAQAMLTCDLPGLKFLSRGKVRDLYDLGDSLLFIATDRISAFDVVMAEGVPDKGRILTRLTVFWLRELGVPSHLLTADVGAMPPEVRKHRALLEGRALLVKKLKIFPVECVVRGYLAGSGLKSYRAGGHVCGVPLPPGLREADKLPEPIFTPTTKATTGHDEDMSFAGMANLIGRERAAELRDKSIAVYGAARDFAAERGIILADTKFEWGIAGDAGPALLADEVLTPDSSRFWPGDEYRPGASQPSFDKQFLRDWLERQTWDKKPPPPRLPPEIVEGTRTRYVEIHRRLTGEKSR
jgi:phosphoribosylaminoimidazole-succinocarboxamide synthase